MKKRPGMQKAIDFVRRGIVSGKLGRKLPSIKSLARAADVSFVTMWKAIDLLRSQGIISRSRQGIGSTVSARLPKSMKEALAETVPPDNYRDMEQTRLLWQKMLSQFKQDILTGRFHPGQLLPSCKELQGIYNVSYPTLRKALDQLSSQGMLKAYRRGYSVPVLVKSAATARIVAIGCGWEDGTLWVDYQDKNYFRILESGCIQAKIALDIVVYCRRNGKLCFVDTVTRKPYDLSNENILSFVVVVANLEIPPEEVFQKLVSRRRPVAILDVVGGWEASPQIFEQRAVSVLYGYDICPSPAAGGSVPSEPRTHEHRLRLPLPQSALVDTAQQWNQGDFQ